MCKKHKENSFIFETNKNTTAKVDGVLIKDNQLSAIFESKCRNMSMMEIDNYGSCVPFIGFLYLIKDDIVMYWKITDSQGNFLFDFDVKQTQTQKTINGGQIVRTNAYLPFNKGYDIL